jgi:glycosyltransferase involved in cell wall biosynthesis
LLDELSDAVKKQNLSERIILLGAVNQPRKMLATLDLYVSINVREMTGIAGLEAVSENIPVVSLQMDQEYFGENDVIWSGHHSSLVDKVAALAISVSERDALRSLQHSYVREHYSISKTYAEYRQLYASIC